MRDSGRRTVVKRFYKVSALLGGCLILGSLPLMPSATGAPLTMSVKFVGNGQSSRALQEGLAYYRGKTVTLIASDAPGGGIDFWARLVQPSLESYLHATVNVENIAGGNTVVGQNAAFHASPNGLTIGTFTPGTDVQDQLTHSGGPDFNPDKLVMLAGTKSSPTCVFSLSSSPYSTFGSLLHTSSPVTEVSQTAGLAVTQLLVNAAFKINAKVITGYADSASELQGFLRGDGSVATLPVETAGPELEAGKARCLMVTTRPAPGFPYTIGSSTPTLAEAASQDIPKTAKVQQRYLSALVTEGVNNSPEAFFVNRSTPNDDVVALRAALKAALEDQTVEKKAAARGEQPGWVSGPTVAQQYGVLVKALTKVKSALTIH